MVHGYLSSGGNRLHNTMMPTDVNEDQFTTAMDALLIINLLNSQGQFGDTPFAGLMADVSQDGSLLHFDALMVIQELNHIASSDESDNVAQQASAAVGFVIASGLDNEEEERVLEE